MFGYVRPLRQELKCKDFDLYRATYCGLCRCLRRRYGPIAPMFLNFDLVFLALLLWQPEERFEACRGRCHANPFVKKQMCQDGAALERAADASILLTWWKLKDTAQDEGWINGLPARFLALLIRPAYQKAKRVWPEYSNLVRSCMEELAKLELDQCTSMDCAADAFARILQGAVPEDCEQRRVLAQLLYHLGRWIYLLDARDDLAEDVQAGRYNPVVARFGVQGDDDLLSLTLDHSREQISAAFQLGNFGCRRAILENIIYLGLPLVQRSVFDGSWAEIKKQKIWSNHQ